MHKRDFTFSDQILSQDYKNPKIKYLIQIYFRTKKGRIKAKLFKSLFKLCLEEKQIMIIKNFDVVLMKHDVYTNLINQIKQLENNLQKTK